MYLRIFLLLLLSIYKIFFLLNCVIYACWGTPWKKFLKSPLVVCIMKHTSCLLARSYGRVLSLYPLLNNFNRALAFLLPTTLHKSLLRQSSLLWSLHFSRINYSVIWTDLNKLSTQKSFSTNKNNSFK